MKDEGEVKQRTRVVVADTEPATLVEKEAVKTCKTTRLVLPVIKLPS